MSTDFIIKRNDLLPVFARTLKDRDENIIDLTGATVKFLMYDYGGTQKVSAAATITDASAGDVEYSWQSGDTDTAAFYKAEFEITHSGGKLQTVPAYEYYVIQVYKDLG